MNDCFQIDEKTFRIEDGFVRFFLVIGTERAAVIDTGATKPEAKQLCEMLTDLPLVLLNTHGDGDHCSGTGAFSEIHIGAEDYVNCKLAEKFPDTVHVALTDGEIIDLGGRRLQAIQIPGHTKGSFAFLDLDNRLLLAGDTVQDFNIFMFGDHRAPEQFAAALQRLVELQSEYDAILSAHGTPVLPGDYAQRVLDAWRAVEHGNILGDVEEVHGNQVLLYKTETCGFYLPIPRRSKAPEN